MCTSHMGRLWQSREFPRLTLKENHTLQVQVSGLVFDSRVDPHRDLLEIISQFGMVSQASLHAAVRLGTLQ